MNIGAKIKRLRLSKMMTQAELAGQHMTRNMLSLIENGAAQPSLNTILYVADRLNVPAGFLLADGDDEFIYRKQNAMSNIKRAYQAKDYRICRDMCKQSFDQADDEIYLILADCAFEIAREEFENGHMHSACRYFDEAIVYSDKTLYHAGRIRVISFGYFTYMRNISLTFFSEQLDLNDRASLMESICCNDEFCRYVGVVLQDDDRVTEDFIRQYSGKEHVLARHADALRDMKRQNYTSAIEKMNAILNSEQKIPEPVIYRIFENLEVCYRESGDYRGAYEYSNNKVGMLDKLLTEHEE